jgi:hypothetical protein
MKQEKNILKMYFETGDKPTQVQYENLIDSLRHAYDKIPLEDLEEEVVSISGDETITGEKIFSDKLIIGYNGTFDGKAYLSATDLGTAATHNILEYGNLGLKFLENAQFTNGLNSTSLQVTSMNTAPTSSTDSGIIGEIRFTSDYIYVCTANNTWKRTTLSTW